MPKRPKRRILIRVQKHEPISCPSCGKSVSSNCARGYLLDLGKLKGAISMAGSPGASTPVICGHCHAQFNLTITETRLCRSVAEARRMLENEGYVNPRAVEVIGSVPRIWPRPKCEDNRG